MDYKEEYEKAYKLLEQIHNGGVVSKVDIENTFPELKKKSIISMLKIAVELTAWLDSDKNKCISWLEKQSDYDKLVEEIKERKELISKEKKKATSSVDRLSLGGRIAMLEELLAFTKEKQGKQKPLGYIHHIDKDGNYTIEPIEQKPMWSEEDEQNFYWISTTIQERPLTPEYTQQVHKILSWLKSLNPQNHWKPTDEQMEALNDAINCYCGNYCVTLESLYEQLKKL